MKAAACALALCACASYRILPLPAQPGPMPVRYEKTRLFFHSVENDGALSRVFSGPGAILATVARPERGVFASADGGTSWAFSAAPAFDAVLYGEHRIFAVAGARVLRSADAGRTWEAADPGDDPVEALALGPDGALYAGGRGRLYVSVDAGRTFRVLTPKLPSKNWRIRSIAALPGALYVSVRGDPPEPQPPSERFAALLADSSAEAAAAEALVESRDPLPRAVQWGTAGDGVYVSRDGGASFTRTGLMLDAWLVARRGALYAVAADPLLQAAASIRVHPDLAGAADRHLRGDRASASSLRAACAFPGREALLGGPIASAPIFLSTRRSIWCSRCASRSSAFPGSRPRLRGGASRKQPAGADDRPPRSRPWEAPSVPRRGPPRRRRCSPSSIPRGCSRTTTRACS